jgi:small-conductance mechanosensitive channel
VNSFEPLAGRLAQVLAQSVDDLEKIEEAVNVSQVSGWDVGAALIVLVLSWPVSRVAGRLTRRVIRRLPNVPDFVPDLADRGAQALVVFIGLAISMSLLGVDIGWFTVTIALVAIVFVLMVRPLIENLAAGMLLETRPSFSIGDEIETNGYTGEVVEINVRSTAIQTRDFRRVHIPNTDVLDDTIVVHTAFDRKRSELELEIEYDADMAETTRILIEAAAGVEGVHAEPPPYVRARRFGTGTFVLLLRWWHDASLSGGSRTLDGVVRAVKASLDAAGIAMPSPEMIVRQPDLGDD